MLDPHSTQFDDGPHRARRERRVDHDWQRRELPMDLLDDVDPGSSIDNWIDDEDVRITLLDGGSQFIPASGCQDRVVRAKNNCEMRKELTREVRYEVHMEPDRMS